MYVYKTLDSKKVQDIEKNANDMAKQGWDLFLVYAADNRHVSIFRKEA